MKPIDAQKILDNSIAVAIYIIDRDIYEPSDIERLLLYELKHKHRKTMEKALIKRMKEVVHIQCTVPTVSDFLMRKW